MIYLYGVVDDPAAARQACAEGPPEGSVVIPAGPFACVARTGAEPDTESDPRSLIDHDLFVRRLMQSCTVVPFRYGTVLPTAGEVRDQMLLRASAFEALMPWLRGRVELALRANWVAEPRPPRCDGSGRSYLRMLEQQEMRALVPRVHRKLSDASVAAVVATDRKCGMKASYLVDKDQVDPFCRLLARTVADVDGVRDVSLTGPWAPYSFVNESVLGPAPSPTCTGVGGGGV